MFQILIALLGAVVGFIKHLHVVQKYGLPIDSVRVEEIDFSLLYILSSEAVFEDLLLHVPLEDCLVIVLEALQDVELHSFAILLIVLLLSLLHG